MNDQLEAKLVAEFPYFFLGYREGRNLLYGFECSDGWFDLIHKLCVDISSLNPPENFRVVQVKEKFGGLRFYVDGSTAEISQLIHQAEEQSYQICENCGTTEGVTTAPNPGKSWVLSFCANCRKAID